MTTKWTHFISYSRGWSKREEELVSYLFKVCCLLAWRAPTYLRLRLPFLRSFQQKEILTYINRTKVCSLLPLVCLSLNTLHFQF